jgi:hypothetical protein
MLDSFKRWISGGSPGADWRAVQAWAQQRGFGFKREREGEGFIVDGRTDDVAWRLEWGPSQRDYLEGQELRIRAPLAMSSDLHMLVLSRLLMEYLERETFERYTESMQTMIDRDTPEEMRWLVLFTKAPAGELKALRNCGFDAVGDSPQGLRLWVDSGVASALEQAVSRWLSPQDPMVLMTLRSRLVLRTELPAPDVQRLAAVVELFEGALRATLRVLAQAPDLGGAPISTAPSAWQSRFQATDISPAEPDKDADR